MSTTKKRLLSLLLCCMMVLTLMPAAALADYASGPYNGTCGGKSFTVTAAEGDAVRFDAAGSSDVDSINDIVSSRYHWANAFAAFSVKSDTTDSTTLTVSGASFDSEKPVYVYYKSGWYADYCSARVDAGGNITFTVGKHVKEGSIVVLTQPAFAFDFTVTPSVTEIIKNADGSNSYTVDFTFSLTPYGDFKDFISDKDGGQNLGVELDFCDKQYRLSGTYADDVLLNLARGNSFTDTVTLSLSDADFENGSFSACAVLKMGSKGGSWQYWCYSEFANIDRLALPVDFNLMGGSGDASSISLKFGETIGAKLPAAPTKEGYTFAGWFDANGNSITADIVVTDALTVYAGWRSEHVPSVLKSSIHDAYVNGYEDGTVRPLDNITRAEAATMLYRLLTDAQLKAIYSDKNDFTDVSADAWFNEAVSTLSNGGYILGFPDGTFRPDEYMTRAEFASVLARLIDPLKSETVYPDLPEEHWAHDDVMTATAAGWIIGTNNGFEPDRCITRAEVITALNRLLDRGIDEDSTLPEGYKTWSDVSVDDWFFYDIVEATNGHEYIGLIPFENWTKVN